MSTNQIIRMGVGIFVSLWMARYLGPENFGKFNYIISIVLIIGAITPAGLQTVVVNKLIKEPEQQAYLMGSTLFIRSILTSLSIIFLLIFSFVANLDSYSIYGTRILTLFFIFQLYEIIEIYFQAKQKLKYSAISRITGTLISAALIVWGIYTKKELSFFFFTFLIEHAINMISLFYFNQKNALSISKWKINFSLSKKLFKESWPLLLSTIALMSYNRIDQVMIKNIIGDTELGYYSAASRLSQLWIFIPYMLSSIFFPIVSKKSKQSKKDFDEAQQSFFDLLSGLAWLLIIPICLLSSWIIIVLYGNQFSNSSGILALHIWTALFVFSRIGLDRWLVIENKTKYNLIHHGGAAILNIILNLLFIPLWGGYGAAWASLLSIGLSTVATALFSSVRPGSIKMFYSWFIPVRIFHKDVRLQIKNIISAN